MVLVKLKPIRVAERSKGKNTNTAARPAACDLQGGSNMTGTNCDLFTHKSSRSYLNHLVIRGKKSTALFPRIKSQAAGRSVSSRSAVFVFLPQGVGLQPVACYDRGFESRRRRGCSSVVSVVHCQVEVSATGRSLVQRSPTNCGCVRLCVIT
jgi:hypothetical protein